MLYRKRLIKIAKQLLAMLEDEDIYFFSLCYSLYEFNKSDYKLFHKYMWKNRPSHVDCIYDYWWFVHDRKPRIEWLKQQIDNLEKQSLWYKFKKLIYENKNRNNKRNSGVLFC